MNKKLINLHEMTFRFKDFVSANKVKLEGAAMAWSLISIILSLIDRFADAVAVQTKDYSGYSATKKLLKDSLVSRLYSFSGLLFNYCKINNLHDDIANFSFAMSRLSAMRYTSLLNQLQFTIAYCSKLSPEELTGLGIELEKFDKFKEETEQFKTYIPLPIEMRNVSKTATEEIEAIRAEMESLFSERLDKVMYALFASDDPALYDAYVKATKIVAPTTRKLAIKGSITNKETQKPVTKAQVVIPEAGIDHQCTGKNGGFQIKNLEAGTYRVQIRAVNYKVQELNVVHHANETNVLEIELEPLSMN